MCVLVRHYGEVVSPIFIPPCFIVDRVAGMERTDCIRRIVSVFDIARINIVVPGGGDCPIGAKESSNGLEPAPCKCDSGAVCFVAHVARTY